MRIVTDNGIDIDPSRLEGLNVHIVPLVINHNGTSYRGGIDIQSDEFYKMLRTSEIFPKTSQPSPGDFTEVYEELIQEDPDIISIHISAEFSGTFNAARLGAQPIENANITVYDSRSVSGAEAWQVEAAARAAKAGWSREKIIALLDDVSHASRILCSPDTLKYLVNGGRVSNLKGFAASMLNIKPILQIRHETGKLEQASTVRTMKKALGKQVQQIADEYGEGTKMRFQIMHADSEDYGNTLRDMLSTRFDCVWLPMTSITPLVGAHAGPGLTGVVYAPESVFEAVP